MRDETDATFSGDKELSETIRGVLNSGYRRGGCYSVCVPNDGGYAVQDFPVFGAKALSGIGVLPDTVQDRGIPIEMRRKLKAEKVERFRRRNAVLIANPIVDNLSTWADEAVPVLEPATPDFPEELGDRAVDVWEPLLAIADMAGGEWPTWARQSAKALSSSSVLEDDSLGVALLKDIHLVFTVRTVDRLASVELASALVEIEESPWGDLRGKPLNASGLARRLKPYKIKPGQIRIAGVSLKGYSKFDFRDAWQRYTPEIGETPETPKQISNSVPSNASESVSPNNDSIETPFQGETENRAYVSVVSGVSASQDMQQAFDAQGPEESGWGREL